MKNKILKTINTVAGILFLVSASSLDSESYIPHVVCGVCLVWFSLFVYANKERMCT